MNRIKSDVKHGIENQNFSAVSEFLKIRPILLLKHSGRLGFKLIELIVVVVLFAGIAYNAHANLIRPRTWIKNKAKGLDSEGICSISKNAEGENVLKITSNEKVAHVYYRLDSSMVKKDELEIDLEAEGKGKGLAGFYFYDQEKRFIGRSFKEFTARAKWTKHKFNFELKDLSFNKKIAFCRIILGTFPNSETSFKSVSFLSKLSKKKYLCTKALTAPDIDGVVLGWDNMVPDRCWRESLKGVCFKKMGTESAAENQTQFSFSYDKQNLYFMAVCYDKNPEKIKATAKTEYDKIWKDECIEVFINCSKPDKSVAHLTFNPLGTVNIIWEGGINTSSSDSLPECRAQIYHDRWELEAKLPWDFLGLKAPPSENESWTVNVTRTNRHKGNKSGIYSTWTYLPGSVFFKPGYFVPFKFTGSTSVPSLTKEMAGPSADSSATGKKMIINIQEARVRKDLNPVTPPVDTARIRWANPFDGKPLKCLFFLECAEREAWELQRRLEMQKADVVFCPRAFRANKNMALFAFNSEEIIKNLKGRNNKYDAIVVAADISNSDLINLITDNVKNGTGLIYLSALNSSPPAAFKKILPQPHPLEEARTNYILRNVAIEGLPYGSETGPTEDNLKKSACKAVESIGFGKYGKGKIVNIGYSKVTDGLIPYPNVRSRGTSEGVSFFDNQICNQWWENVFSLLMRSICWVCGYKPKCEIDSIFVGPDKKFLNVAFSPATKDHLILECIWDSKKIMSSQKTEGEIIKVPDNVNNIRVNIPPDIRNCNGVHLCHLILKSGKNKKTIDWASAALANQSHLKIKNLNSDKKLYKTAESARLKCHIVSNSKKGQDIKLLVRVKDPFGRIIQEQIQKAYIKNEDCIEVLVPLKRILTVQAFLELEIRTKNKDLLDYAKHKISIPENHVTNDYIMSVPLFSGWGFRNYLYPAYEKLLNQTGIRRHGFFPHSKLFTPYPERFNPRTGILGFYEPHHYSGEKKEGDKFKRHTRVYCYAFNDNFLKKRIGRFCKAIDTGLSEGIDCFAMCDEGGLAGHGGNIPESDHCYCQRCRNNFREYARKLYGTIENANKEWDTDFKDWNSINPMVLEEAWEKKDKNYSLWVDYKLYMEEDYLDAFRKVKKKTVSVFPDVRLSLPNAALNFGSREPLSGENYRKWAPEESFSLKYFGPMSTLGYNSFSGKDIPRCSWWGYSEPVSRIRYMPWWYTFNNIIPMWWGAMTFWTSPGSTRIGPFNLFSWNITHTERSLTLKETNKDLVRGVGKLILGAEPAGRQVAMLYSQPSFYAACAEKQDGRYLASELQWRNLIRGAGYELNFIATDELAGKLRDYKVLVLPYSIALSAANQNVIAEFVKSGGILFSDCIPGHFDSHGKYFNKETTIAGIIKKASGTEKKYGDYRKIKYGNGEIILTDRNPSWSKDWKIFRKTLTEKGIKSPICSITNSNSGKVLGLFESYVFKKGNCLFYGILGNTYGQHGRRMPLQKIPIEIELEKKAHIYDVRKQKYLGFTDSVKTEAGLDNALFYAAMPYKIEDINLSCQFDPAGRILNYEAAVETANPEDQVFRLEIYDPDGNPVPCYTKNHWTKKGKLKGAIPFALNDKTGKWKLKLIDVISGIVREKEFVIPEKAAKKGNAKHV